MLKTLTLVVAGLIVGAALALWMQPPADPGFTSTPAFADTSALASDVATLTARLAETESRMRELGAELETLRAAQTAAAVDSERAAEALAVARATAARLEAERAALAPPPVGGSLAFSSGGAVFVPDAPGPGGANRSNAATGGAAEPANAVPAAPEFGLRRPAAAGNGPGAAPGPGSGASSPAATDEASAADPAGAGPPEAPLVFSEVEAEPGQSFVYRVTGANDGPVWGTDIYTDDSSIAAAAVHAGVLRPGETGAVRLAVLPGYPSYPASTRYGVTSGNWAEWRRSFMLQRLF